MSLKAEIERWVSALQAYEKQDFPKALSIFHSIADTSKILFNIALIHATLGQHDEAVAIYRKATNLDEYLSVANFQSGVSQFLLGHYRAAYNDFDASYQQLRGNWTIDYDQIGLKFRLYSCEVLFNRGLSRIMLGRTEAGLADLKAARAQSQTEEHSVIDEALGAGGQGFTVFSIPVGVLFRPSESKVRNLKPRDYLGKAKLVAATEEGDAYIGFSGTARQQQEKERAAAKQRRERKEAEEAKAIPPGMRRGSTESVPPSHGPKAMRSQSSSRSKPTTAGSKIRNLPEDRTVSLKEALPPGPKVGRSKPSSHSRSESAPSHQRFNSPPAHRSRPSLPQLTSGASDMSTVPAQRSSQSGSSASGYSSPRSSSPLSKPSATPPPIRRPSGTQSHSLPAIPQEADDEESDAFDDFFEEYSRLGDDEVIWQEDPKEEERQSPGRATRVVKSVDKTANPNLGRSPSERKPNSASSSSRSPWHQRPRYQEDKGYESGMGEDKPSRLERIRIKLHYAGDVRGLPVDASLGYAELVARIQCKFGKEGLKLRFKDEDGSMMSLLDEEDWICAVDTCAVLARGRADAKLDIFVD